VIERDNSQEPKVVKSSDTTIATAPTYQGSSKKTQLGQNKGEQSQSSIWEISLIPMVAKKMQCFVKVYRPPKNLI